MRYSYFYKKISDAIKVHVAKKLKMLQLFVPQMLNLSLRHLSEKLLYFLSIYYRYFQNPHIGPDM